MSHQIPRGRRMVEKKRGFCKVSVALGVDVYHSLLVLLLDYVLLVPGCRPRLCYSNRHGSWV